MPSYLFKNASVILDGRTDLKPSFNILVKDDRITVVTQDPIEADDAAVICRGPPRSQRATARPCVGGTARMSMRGASRPQSPRGRRRPTTSRDARSAPRRGHVPSPSRHGLRPVRRHKVRSSAIPPKSTRLKTPDSRDRQSQHSRSATPAIWFVVWARNVTGGEIFFGTLTRGSGISDPLLPAPQWRNFSTRELRACLARVVALR